MFIYDFNVNLRITFNIDKGFVNKHSKYFFFHLTLKVRIHFVCVSLFMYKFSIPLI